MRVRDSIWMLLAAASAVAACEHLPQGVMASPEPVPLRLTVPESAYRLRPEERARVRPIFDADALERLLAMIRPDMRDEVLKHFVRGSGGERLGLLTQFTDPELQIVLEEVWVPWWDTVPDRDLEIDDQAGIPGRRIAQERRAAKRRAQMERAGSPTSHE